MVAQQREFGAFATTHWSLVRRAGRDDGDARREALGDLLSRYLPALRAHLVYGRRVSPHDAEDLLQEFVAARLLAGELLDRANPQSGRFRSFLLKALDHFLIDQHRRRRAAKRAPQGGSPSPLDEAQWAIAEGEPSDAFETAWARSVLDEALRRMRQHCEEAGRPDCWGVFECRVLGPILEGTEPAGYDDLVRRFGFQSPAQASNVLVTAKRMFVRALRSVVGEYALGDDEIDAEIVHLRKALSRIGT